MTVTLVNTLRVFLCDDTPELRARVRGAFAAHADLTVVGEADDPVDGLPMIEQMQPDVVLMDLSMPRMDGLEAIPLVAELAPDAAIVVFSGFLGSAMAAKALALGADGYMEKSASLDAVAETIRVAVKRRAGGERPMAELPAVVPAPEEPQISPAHGRTVEDAAQFPGERVPMWVRAGVALLAYGISLAFSAITGLGPDVLLFLYVPPPLCLAGRGGLTGAALVGMASGVVYAYAGHLADRTDIVATGIAMGVASGGLALAISFARGRIIQQAEERAALTRELQRANQELDSFASVASHDLAAPLRTIAGFAGLLERRYQGRLDAEADEFIAYITKGTERMQQTIDDLLAFARAGRIFPAETPFSLEGPLAGARMNLQAIIEERGVAIHHGPLPMVWGDERRISQVLQNLLGNGIKFCPPDRTPVLDVSAVRIPSGWRVEVRDNGIGIDPRHAGRAFGMFQRLQSDDAYPGTGIGLAICQRIVERHGGRIWIDPAPTGGTVVAFTLPDQI